MPTLIFNKVTKQAYPPIRATPESAGLDLYSAGEITLPTKNCTEIPTKLRIIIPKGYRGIIKSRSGPCLKNHLIVLDSGGGEEGINVIIYNHGKNDYKVKKGDRIAQLICEEILSNINTQEIISRNYLNMNLSFNILNADAFEPTRATPEAAGLDLYSVCDAIISNEETCSISTGLQFLIPEGCYGNVVNSARAELLTQNISIVGGVIDRDYRGEVKVIVQNYGKKTHKVKRGDCIAQIICQRICYPISKEVAKLKDDSSIRGSGGFGSTGH